MAKVFLNPEKLQEHVDAYREAIEEAELQIDAIDRKSDEVGDPMRGPDIGEFLPRMRATASHFAERLVEIEAYKQRIEELSSNGIAMKGRRGVIELDLPDEIDSKEKLDSWAKAAVDGRDFKSVADSDGKSTLPNLPSGRSYEELIESLKNNKNNPGYADYLIDSIGAENLTKIPVLLDGMRITDPHRRAGAYLSLDDCKNVADYFGDALLTASKRWGRKRSEEVANLLVSSVDEPGEWGRITALNIMLKRPQNPDLDKMSEEEIRRERERTKFNAPFLLSLGEGLEGLPWNEIRMNSEWMKSPHKISPTGKRAIGPYLDGESFDPMTGLMEAMADNESAALYFLAPSDGSMDRLRTLSERDWDEAGMSGFAGALGAASSKRSSEVGGERARANNLAGHALRYLSEYTEESDYSAETKARLGVLLGNCAPEVKGVSLGAGVSDRHLGVLPAATKEDVETMLFRVADNRDAMATVGIAIGGHTRETAIAAADVNSDDKAKIDAIDLAYAEGAQAAGYVGAIADRKAEIKTADASAENADIKNAVQSGVQAFASAATIGASAAAGPVGVVLGSTVGQGVTSVGTTLLVPIAADAIVGEPEKFDSANPESYNDVVKVAPVVTAVEVGLISQEDLLSAGDRSWIKQDSNGVYRIDFSGAEASDYQEVVAWTRDLDRPESRHPVIRELYDNFGGDYSHGSDKGVTAANSASDREG